MPIVKYSSHDLVYKRKKESGLPGWQEQSITDENYQNIESLCRDHIHSESQLLELGCGAGDLSLHLLKHTSNIHGVDISETAINWAKSKIPLPKFMCGDMMQRSLYKPNVFDIAIDSCFFHCIIGDDRSHVLKNIHTWLKLKGKLMIYTMCGEPRGVLLNDYDPLTKNITVNGQTIRHIGDSDQVIQEIEKENFKTLYKKIIPSEEGQTYY